MTDCEPTSSTEARRNSSSVSRPNWIVNELDAPTGYGVQVGIIDSGWDSALDLSEVRNGIGFVDPEDDLATQKTDDDHDRLGHGTACGALIHQVAPDASLYPIRVFGDKLETSPSTIGAAIKWAIEQDLDVVNISLGTLRDDILIPLYKICEQARQENIVLVASRHNTVERSYPSVFENVISVGIGPFDNPFDFQYRSNQAVECLAKGQHERVLWLNGTRESVSGTSFAAPNITGLVALFLERYPDANLETVRTLLDRFSLPGS